MISLRDLRDLREPETSSRLLLRTVVLAAPVLAVVCGWPVATPSAWSLLAVGALAAGWAVWPESASGTACLALVVVWWAFAAGDGLPGTAVPAALLLLTAHVAALLLGHGPPRLAVGRSLSLRWLRRAGVAAATVPAVWLVALAVRDRPEPPGIWVAGLTCAVVLCVVAAVAVSVDGPVGAPVREDEV